METLFFLSMSPTIHQLTCPTRDSTSVPTMEKVTRKFCSTEWSRNMLIMASFLDFFRLLPSLFLHTRIVCSEYLHDYIYGGAIIYEISHFKQLNTIGSSFSLVTSRVIFISWLCILISIPLPQGSSIPKGKFCISSWWLDIAQKLRLYCLSCAGAFDET